LFFIHPYGSAVHEKVSTYDYDDLEIADPARFHVSSRNFYERKYLSHVQSECMTAKSILDVGCGTGALLELLGNKNPGMRRVGVELNYERAEFARGVAGCEIHQGPIEEFRCDGRFDVITMINVLSHIPSIDDLFDSIRSLLATDGKVVLKVSEMAVDVKKDSVFDWGIPDHLHFLGLNTMNYICSKYGFRILRHDRQPFSEDMFSRGRWLSPGRSRVRNLVKRAVALTPFALLLLRTLYDMRHGRKIYSSFIVLSPAGE
jgi:SAM-dependent methyltransferase